MDSTWAFLVWVVSLGSQFHPVLAIKSCKMIDACSCRSDLGVIDLKPLEHDGKPGLEAHTQTTDYYFNPCKNFDMGTVKDAGAVQYLQQYKSYYKAGDNKKAAFDIVAKTGDLRLTLKTVKDGRESIITLICDKSKTEFKFMSEAPTKTYNFELRSKECCPGAKPRPSGSSSSGLSVGSIMCIILFTSIIVYLVAGVLINAFARKRDGIERIPNVTFWTALPGLIKDGIKFTFTCGKSSQSYDRI